MLKFVLLVLLATGSDSAIAGCSSLPAGYAPPYPGCKCIDAWDRESSGEIRDSRWACPNIPRPDSGSAEESAGTGTITCGIGRDETEAPEGPLGLDQSKNFQENRQQ